jgi:dTMP kinase
MFRVQIFYVTIYIKTRERKYVGDKKEKKIMSALIVIEGPEGAGKTTLINGLMGEFPQAVMTREPGGTTIGTRIRELLLDPENKEMTPLTELVLFYADRAQHIHEAKNGMKSLRNKGKMVIVDRADPSTIAYQVFGRERPQFIDEALRLSSLVWEVSIADIRSGHLFDGIICLDIDPAEGLRRKQRQSWVVGGERLTRIDREEVEFHQRVRVGFQTMAKQSLFGPWQMIDGMLEKQEIIKRAAQQIRNWLNPHAQ